MTDSRVKTIGAEMLAAADLLDEIAGLHAELAKAQAQLRVAAALGERAQAQLRVATGRVSDE